MLPEIVTFWHGPMDGLDDIGLTMEKKGSIDTYEEKLKRERAWA